jgi:hypothetical protein
MPSTSITVSPAMQWRLCAECDSKTGLTDGLTTHKVNETETRLALNVGSGISSIQDTLEIKPPGILGR